MRCICDGSWRTRSRPTQSSDASHHRQGSLQPAQLVRRRHRRLHDLCWLLSRRQGYMPGNIPRYHEICVPLGESIPFSWRRQFPVYTCPLPFLFSFLLSPPLSIFFFLHSPSCPRSPFAAARDRRSAKGPPAGPSRSHRQKHLDAF